MGNLASRDSEGRSADFESVDPCSSNEGEPEDERGRCKTKQFISKLVFGSKSSKEVVKGRKSGIPVG